MRKCLFYVLSVALMMLALSRIAAWASCDEMCGGQCEYLGSGPEWTACMDSCVRDCLEQAPDDVAPPDPDSDLAPPEDQGDLPSHDGSVRRPVQTNILADADQRYVLAQNDNYVPCYKEKDFKKVLFRWCPADKPWTPTHEMRNFCYVTLEACAEAEMPQTWCIKCEKAKNT